MCRVSEWRERVSVVANVVIVVVKGTLSVIDDKRVNILKALLALLRDACELRDMRALCDFMPTEPWSRLFY